MLEALAGLPLAMIVVDESHGISQWGHSFRPEYRALERLRAHFPDVPIGMILKAWVEVPGRTMFLRL